MFGKDLKDLAGIASQDGEAVALCETCGWIIVDNDGKRLY